MQMGATSKRSYSRKKALNDSDLKPITSFSLSSLTSNGTWLLIFFICGLNYHGVLCLLLVVFIRDMKILEKEYEN